MSKNNTHKSYSEMWQDKNEEKRKRKYVHLRDKNKCGNNLWQRRDSKTLVLLCKQTGKICNMNYCPLLASKVNLAK